MKTHLKRALQFIADHPGHRTPAFLGGWKYYFDAPERKRSPFKVGTVNDLVDQGLVRVSGRRDWQRVEISSSGRAAIGQ